MSKKSSRNFLKPIPIKPMCPCCSYCGSKMNLTANQVKRRVPKGAIDLEKYMMKYIIGNVSDVTIFQIGFF